MREGERARIHVPAALGYGVSPQGSKVARGTANPLCRQYQLIPALAGWTLVHSG